VASLDVSIQAQIINLLKELQEVFGLTIVFVAHDLAVVRQIATKIMVIYLGRNVEYGVASSVYARPLHPYTKALLAAVPTFQAGKTARPALAAKGEMPSPYDPPSGCHFRTRCLWAEGLCAQRTPDLLGDESHQVACWKADSLAKMHTPLTIAETESPIACSQPLSGHKSAQP
jgi:oligopeptide transport system ATP-binding protein